MWANMLVLSLQKPKSSKGLRCFMDSIQLYHDFLLSLTKNLQWYGPWTLEQLRNRAGSRTRWTESQVCTLVYLCEGWIAWTQSCRCLSIPLKHKQKAHPVVRHLQPVADKCHIHQVSATAFRRPSAVQRQTTKGRREINKKMCHTWRDSKTWKLFQCLSKGRNIADLILTACLCRHYGCLKMLRYLLLTSCIVSECCALY